MIYHLGPGLPTGFSPIVRFGWMGVDLFFVLSGYLIGSQLLRRLRNGQSIAFADFYRKRTYRIVPAYLVVLALYVFVPTWREDGAMAPLWQFLTFTENLFVDYAKYQAFSPVWSLCVEEHFYLFFPLIAFWLMRKPALWKTVSLLALFLLMGMGIRAYELVHVVQPVALVGKSFDVVYMQHIYFPTYTRLDGLLAGVTLALIKIFRPTWWAEIAKRANACAVAGLIVVVVSMWMFAYRFHSVTGVAAAGTVIGFPLLSSGFALLVASGIESGSWLGRARVPGTKLLATLAFSLYLTHKAVAHLDNLHFPQIAEGRDWRSVVLLFVSCFACAGLLYVCVERPFLALRDRRHRALAALDAEARAEPAL
jgi:peptidoglycan/LPS O-acetylase OafA/YrhL